MIRLSRLFGNWFLAPDISLAELSRFAEDALARLTANNPGDVFDEEITALDSALASLGGARGLRASATAIRESRTRATEMLLRQMLETIRRRHGRVVDEFGKKGDVYQAFFPQGLTAYAEMKYPDVESRLDVLIAAATAHLPALTAEFTGLKTQWQTVRGAQLSQKGTVATGKDGESAAREVIAKTLMVTVLRVAAEFVGDEEKASVYFNQSLLENAANPEPDEVD